MARIRHIAIFADDPGKMAEFYANVFGMEITGSSDGAYWVTDGYLDVALIPRRRADSHKGIHHFGFTLEESEKDKVYEKLKGLGLEPFDPRRDNLNVDRPYVEDASHDIEGNRYDLSTGMRNLQPQRARSTEGVS